MTDNDPWNATLDELLKSAKVLEGLYFREVTFGPCGLNGTFDDGADAPLPRPELAWLFHGGLFTCKDGQEREWTAINNLGPEEQAIFILWAVGRRVVGAEVLPKNHALRITLEGEIRVTFYCEPDVDDTDAFWGIYPQPPDALPSYIVYRDKIRRVHESAESEEDAI